jgi:hypothetical protein
MERKNLKAQSTFAREVGTVTKSLADWLRKENIQVTHLPSVVDFPDWENMTFDQRRSAMKKYYKDGTIGRQPAKAKTLTKQKQIEYLSQFNGDVEKAKAQARKAGYQVD